MTKDSKLKEKELAHVNTRHNNDPLKKLSEAELKKVNGGAQIVTKESEDNDSERDFNRLNNLCQRRDPNITDTMNLMKKIIDNNSEIKLSK